MVHDDQNNNLLARSIGEAADNFGKEVAPLGTELGAATVKVGRLLITGLETSVYGIERVAEWMRDAIAHRLASIPEEKIVEPNPRISVPATQALIYSMNEEHIREMFANLLAADMDADKKKDVHPAFVELIKEMTSTEANILRFVCFNGSQTAFEAKFVLDGLGHVATFGQQYSIDIGVSGPILGVGLSNLERLGLIQVRDGFFPVDDKFDAIEKEFLKRSEARRETVPEKMRDKEITISRQGIYLTKLGSSFSKVCLGPGENEA